MVNECCHFLNILPNRLYLDCTLGGGGHTLAILQRGGNVIALDQDFDSIKKIQNDPIFAPYLHNNQLEIHQTNFSSLKNIIFQQSKLCQQLSSPPAVHGVLFDLGISSHQIDNISRGFTYRYDESPLDMRMSQHPSPSSPPHDPHHMMTASELVNQLSTQELANLFYTFGDERRSRQIATAIVSTRPHHTSSTLRVAIESVTRPSDHIKTLSRCYQALRIVVNHEIDCLQNALHSLHEVVHPSGRLVVLSYHSLEDKIIKKFLQKKRIKEKKLKYHKLSEDDDEAEEGEDVMEEEVGEWGWGRNVSRSPLEDSSVHWKTVQNGVIKPSKEEIQRNNRARSAKLRVGERV
jgi:16S rRNA (cytosine1402-N4)-methyltransferase